MHNYKLQHCLNLAACHLCSACAWQKATEGRHACLSLETIWVMGCVQNMSDFMPFFCTDALNCWQGETLQPPLNFSNSFLWCVSLFPVSPHCNHLMQPLLEGCLGATDFFSSVCYCMALLWDRNVTKIAMQESESGVPVFNQV